MKISVGVDVSKDTLDVAFVGKNIAQRSFSNSEWGIGSLLKIISEQVETEIVVTMEATGVYHLNLAVHLLEAGLTVSVVNPLIIKRYGEMKMLRAKTDPVDARMIADYGYNQEPILFVPKPKECQQIVGFLNVIEDYLGIKTQNTNRLESLQFQPERQIEIIDSIKRINGQIDREIKVIEKMIHEVLIENNKDAYNHVMSIPGIGKRTASAMIGYFNHFENFETAKQVSSYIGINPSPYSSGSSVRGRGSISKKGNGYLRKLLYMAALSASRSNEQCKNLYKRLLAQGKCKKVILIAIANKLLRQIFAIIKFRRDYSSNYEPVFSKVD